MNHKLKIVVYQVMGYSEFNIEFVGPIFWNEVAAAEHCEKLRDGEYFMPSGMYFEVISREVLQ